MCKSFLSANNPTTFSSKKELGNCTTRENFQHNPSLRVLTYASHAHAHVYMYVYICVYVCMNVWMCVYMDEGEKTCSVLTWHIAHGKDSHELCMWQHWVFLRTYIHTHIHTFTHVHTYIHTFIHSLTYIHTYTHSYMYLRTYIHTHIHTCTHVHTYIHTFTTSSHVLNDIGALCTKIEERIVSQEWNEPSPLVFHSK